MARAVLRCTTYAFLLTWWLLCFCCCSSDGQACSPACLGLCHCFPFRFFYGLFGGAFFFFFPPNVDFLYYLAVAVELELLGGSSSLFPSFLFIATHHLGVTLQRRGGVRAGGLLQRPCPS